MADFDVLCDTYEDVLDKDLHIFGERHSYFTEFKALWIKKFLDKEAICQNPKFLDIGCGTGTLHDYINSHIPKATCYGIDISFRSIKKARLENRGIKSFYCAYNGINIPFKGNSFDLVILAGVLHHVSKEEVRSEILKEAYRVVNPGGYLVIFEHNPYNPVTRYIVKKCVIDKGAELLDLKATKGALSRCNFEVIRADYIVFFPHFLRMFRFLEERLSWLFLGAQYVIVAKKI